MKHVLVACTRSCLETGASREAQGRRRRARGRAQCSPRVPPQCWPGAAPSQSDRKPPAMNQMREYQRLGRRRAEHASAARRDSPPSCTSPHLLLRAPFPPCTRLSTQHRVTMHLHHRFEDAASQEVIEERAGGLLGSLRVDGGPEALGCPLSSSGHSANAERTPTGRPHTCLRVIFLPLCLGLLRRVPLPLHLLTAACSSPPC